MNITIEVDGVVRRYTLDEHDVVATDWTEVMEDIIDSINQAKEL